MTKEASQVISEEALRRRLSETSDFVKSIASTPGVRVVDPGKLADLGATLACKLSSAGIKRLNKKPGEE